LTVVAHNARPGSIAHQRRSQRILLSVPLVVSGKHANGAPFTERTTTLVVSAHGALILLREPVILEQTLNITHVVTGEKLACTVKDISPGTDGLREIGIEFAQSSARFWRVSFPPPDWGPRSPEAKRFANQSVPPAKPAEVKK